MNIKLYINKTRHQYKNSECGIYSIYFITKLVENNDFNGIPDTLVRTQSGDADWTIDASDALAAALCHFQQLRLAEL